MNIRLIKCVFLFVAGVFPSLMVAQQSHIQSTDPLTPEQQLAKFHLPPGFKIELFAAGPQIEKPTNLAFDGQGRMWVSSTHEYPVAAEPGKGQDRIQILTDTDGDGRADSASTFADGLNIPMGLYPYREGVISYSIPNIYFFDDASGEGTAAKREVLFGPLGVPLDTHGLQNSFRRGFDGWVYVNHGYRNDSILKGTDGSEISINGGHTYRFQPDGSRVEVFAWGQVNPFGSTFLPNGDMVSIDCHSYPVSFLLRGGFYESFGKSHDGMGFVPKVMLHMHGPTAICGVAAVKGTNFPEEYQDSLLVGNVVSSRVRRDTVTYHGSTADLREEADFLTCDDPWFRPVDLQFGPDGALYVADFYNRIIGHYEVAIDHPGRDRKRGRIWRITYVGDSPGGEAAPALSDCDLATSDLVGLIEALSSPMLGTRMMATDQISDRFGNSAIEPVRAAMATSTDPLVHVHGLWILFRLGVTTPSDLDAAVQNTSPLVRNHAMRVLAELPNWSDAYRKWAIDGLNDGDAFVRRSSADALGQHPEIRNISVLIGAFEATPSADTHLRHTIRLALRNHLRETEVTALVRDTGLSDSQLGLMAGVALAVKSEEAAGLVLDSIGRVKTDKETFEIQLRHVAREGGESALTDLIKVIRQRYPEDVDLQIEFLELIDQQIPKSSPNRNAVLGWSRSLLAQLQRSGLPESNQWVSRSDANPWGLEDRNCSDGKMNVSFLSSLPGGESTTGVLASRPFELPEELGFYLSGHRGLPKDPAGMGNQIRLRLVENGKIIKTAYPPRNDIAQPIQWDLRDFVGQQAVLEAVDGNTLDMFAWLAVSRFEPAVVEVPQLSPQRSVKREIAQARIARTMRLIDQVPRLKAILVSQHADRQVQIECATALAELEPSSLARALVAGLSEASLDFEMRSGMLAAIAGSTMDREEILKQAMKVAPFKIQESLAARLASDQDGARLLIKLVTDGNASARLLQRKDILENLIATRLPNAASVIAKLTKNLPPVEEQTLKLIEKLSGLFTAPGPSAALGRVVFKDNCAVCHQVGGVGNVVGPQLDGIGVRGAGRLLEDILDSNRNVDGAFVSSVVLLDDGRVLSGLFRKMDGDQSIFVNSEGKEFSIETESIEEQKKSHLSVMPGNFSTTLKEEDSVNLVAYLLTLNEKSPTPVAWDYINIDKKFRAEGVAVADVNRDGKPDVMTGEFWYEAPEWTAHEIAQPGDYGDGAHGYSHCFACFTSDVNQDGWPDQIVIGFPATPCHWYENPRGEKGHWKKHEIWESACNETPIFIDLFGTGKRVLVMGWYPDGNAEKSQMIWLEPGSDPTDSWDVHAISRRGTAERPIPGTQRFSHGLGAGDINGDGRQDVISTGGWWEQPESVGDREWVFHPVNLGPACANMFVADLDGDQRADVVSSSAHQYGIWWHQQQPESSQANPPFQRRDLFTDLISQTHAMQFVDMDGDGERDLVTGKRFWAHGPGGDPGSEEPANLFWFEAVKGDDGTTTFVERLIHSDSGIGTQFVVVDVNGDDLPDVVTSNKKGVHLFLQRRREVDGGE